MSDESEIVPTPRTRLKRVAARGSHDRDRIHAILDAGFICHAAFVIDGEPRVLPTVYARRGDALFLHGSSANQMLRSMRDGGVPTAVCVTHVDGVVLARSAFHTSVNYRSVVVFGRAVEVPDPEEKRAALRDIVEHVAPERWREVREPSLEELRRTLVLRMPLDEASAKLRGGGPIDDEADYALSCWAGHIPLHVMTGNAIPDPRLAPGVDLPPHLASYRPPDGRDRP